jgi:hypothetical protein
VPRQNAAWFCNQEFTPVRQFASTCSNLSHASNSNARHPRPQLSLTDKVFWIAVCITATTARHSPHRRSHAKRRISSIYKCTCHEWRSQSGDNLCVWGQLGLFFNVLRQRTEQFSAGIEIWRRTRIQNLNRLVSLFAGQRRIWSGWKHRVQFQRGEWRYTPGKATNQKCERSISLAAHAGRDTLRVFSREISPSCCKAFQ